MKKKEKRKLDSIFKRMIYDFVFTMNEFQAKVCRAPNTEKNKERKVKGKIALYSRKFCDSNKFQILVIVKSFSTTSRENFSITR